MVFALSASTKASGPAIASRPCGAELPDTTVLFSVRTLSSLIAMPPPLCVAVLFVMTVSVSSTLEPSSSMDNAPPWSAVLAANTLSLMVASPHTITPPPVPSAKFAENALSSIVIEGIG